MCHARRTSPWGGIACGEQSLELGVAVFAETFMYGRSTTVAHSTAGHVCGRGGPVCRFGPGGASRRCCCSPSGSRGTDRRPGRFEAAPPRSCADTPREIQGAPGDAVTPCRGSRQQLAIPHRYRRPGWDRLGLWGFAALTLNGVWVCVVLNRYLCHAVSHPLSRLCSCSIR